MTALRAEVIDFPRNMAGFYTMKTANANKISICISGSFMKSAIDKTGTCAKLIERNTSFHYTLRRDTL